MTARKILTRDLPRDRFAGAIDAIYRGEIPAYVSIIEMVAKQNIDTRFITSATRLFHGVEDTRNHHSAFRLL